MPSRGAQYAAGIIGCCANNAGRRAFFLLFHCMLWKKFKDFLFVSWVFD
jgi:hypothetical protein